jgi:hypothetical protein
VNNNVLTGRSPALFNRIRAFFARKPQSGACTDDEFARLVNPKPPTCRPPKSRL